MHKARPRNGAYILSRMQNLRRDMQNIRARAHASRIGRSAKPSKSRKEKNRLQCACRMGGSHCARVCSRASHLRGARVALTHTTWKFRQRKSFYRPICRAQIELFYGQNGHRRCARLLRNMRFGI